MNSTTLTRQRQGKQSARCNDDDRGLRLKQGGVVGAAASKTRVPLKARSGCWEPQPVAVASCAVPRNLGMSNKRTPVLCSGCPHTPARGFYRNVQKECRSKWHLCDMQFADAACALKRKRLSMAGKNKNRDAPVVKRCVPFLFSFVHSAVPEPCVPRSGCRANQKLHRARKRKREYGMEESEPLAEGSAALVRFG